ncbi:MAG: DUF3313 family protein [Verrucomicrobiota bacterium]
MKPACFSSKLAILTLAAASVAASGTAFAGLIKADPAPLSPFLEHRAQMHPNHDRAPFNKVWRNPSPKAWAQIRHFNKIYIAPINVTYLDAGRVPERDVAGVAHYMRSRFATQFARSGAYKVVSKPGPNTLTLQLAMTRLRATNAPANVLTTAAGVVAPGTELITLVATHGDIAFEGKLRNGQNGQLLEEFADREDDKLSAFSFRDYLWYSHDRNAIDDWSKQMEQLSHTSRNVKVNGASRVTLNPF